jgi:site-specific recombinase XerD
LHLANSKLAQTTRDALVNRYGAFLGFLQRNGRLSHDGDAGAQVTWPNVEAFVADLKARVGSVTVWNTIHALRMAVKLLAPAADFSWLGEIEKDLALVMEPRSKYDRLVFSDRLVKAGLNLIAEAQEYAPSHPSHAKRIRDGLMIALLAVKPIRLKNFADLEIGHTFKQVHESWWIALPRNSTKSGRPDEGRIPTMLNRYIELYLNAARPVLLLRSGSPTNAMWINRMGKPFTPHDLGTLISKITLHTLGIRVSPHLFRTAAATTAATFATDMPHLASAVLGHTDPRVTEQHYIRATSLRAADIYSGITESFLRE